MTDSPSASSPDTGSDSHQALALRKATDSDEPLPRHTFQFLYRSVDLLWPGSEDWAWLSIGASVGAVERQLAKGWVEVRL